MTNYTLFAKNLNTLTSIISDKKLDDSVIPFLYNKIQQIINYITQKITDGRLIMHYGSIEKILDKYFPSDIAKYAIISGTKLMNEIFVDNNFVSYHIDLKNFNNTRYYFTFNNNITEIGVMLVGVIQYIIEDLIDMASDGNMITVNKLKEVITKDKEFNNLFTKIIITNHAQDLLF